MLVQKRCFSLVMGHVLSSINSTPRRAYSDAAITGLKVFKHTTITLQPGTHSLLGPESEHTLR